MPMTTKLYKLGMYNEDLPLIKSQGSLMTWSCNVA